MNYEELKAMIVGIPVIFIGLLCLVYFSIKDDQDFINNCKAKGGTIIQQKDNIIKKVREYIKERYNGEVLTHTFDKDNVGELLEILKGSE